MPAAEKQEERDLGVDPEVGVRAEVEEVLEEASRGEGGVLDFVEIDAGSNNNTTFEAGVFT